MPTQYDTQQTRREENIVTGLITLEAMAIYCQDCWRAICLRWL